MPFVQLQLFGARTTDADVAALQARLTDLMAQPLRKKPELTVVSVTSRDARVARAGVELRAGEWTAQLTAFVTAGTNTPDEKAAFQATAHAMLVERFGQPAAPLYVIVQEVDGTDWGYGGLPQAVRARAALPA